MVLTFLNGPDEGRTEVYPLGKVLIGRDSDCDLCFDLQRDLEVSGRHAEIRRVTMINPKGKKKSSGKNFEIVDLGSTNGTWIDGVELPNQDSLKVAVDSAQGLSSDKEKTPSKDNPLSRSKESCTDTKKLIPSKLIPIDGAETSAGISSGISSGIITARSSNPVPLKRGAIIELGHGGPRILFELREGFWIQLLALFSKRK